MLTARSQDRDVTQALEEFADDYVVKPFMTRELVVRIERVLRRVADFSYIIDEKASIGSHLEIDFNNRQVTVAGNAVSLTPTEAKILQILFERGGRTVTTDMLIRQVWPFEDVPEQRLRVHVSRLRRKLQHDSETDYIVAERGMGYRLQD
jgi:DNA-binding response OmpR family regulator